MELKRIILVGVFSCVSYLGFGQRIWDGEYSRLGLQAGINRFTLTTDALPISPGISWTAGATTWDSFYNNFQFIYGINFFDFKLTMDGRERESPDSPYAEIPYTMIGVQANFFGSLKIMENHLSLYAGPILQLNGKFDARQDTEYYFIQGYDLNPIELEDVSSVNYNFAIGVAGGMEKVKLWIQYQYGVNNLFKKLTDEGLGEKEPGLAGLSGHLSMLNGGLLVFL